MDQHQRSTVLLAVRPQGVERLTNVLAEDFSLIFCHSLSDVQEQLSPCIDAVVCGTNFDESRMFELLRTVKSDSRYQSLPFVCAKVLDGVLNESTYASVKKASTLMGASAFFDLAQASLHLGDAQAAEALRTTLHDLINVNA